LTDNSSSDNILSLMEQEPTRLEQRMKAIRRRGGTPTLVEGKLVVEWPIKQRSMVSVSNVQNGVGKRIAYPRGG
jgi:hypothetical protein